MRGAVAYDGGNDRSATAKGCEMKKVLIVLILLAIGVAVAKKVREA